MTPFRDSFHSDMWRDFEEPFMGFARPHRRRQVPRENGNFFRMTNPWGFPLDVQEQRMRSKRKDVAKSDPMETPSTSIDSRPTDENIGFGSEALCEPTKALRKRNCEFRQNKNNSTCPECSEADCIQSERLKSAVNANTSENSEDLKRSQGSEQNAHEGEFERKEINSENFHESTEDEEQPEESDKKETNADEKNIQNENFAESPEDRDKMTENENEDEEEKQDELEQPSEEENKLQKDEFINKKIAAINTELSKARELLARVNNFNGTKEDKEYLCLQELLLRCILSLDLIESDGNTEVKTVRRAAVKEIQQIINELEDKVNKL